MIQLQPNQEKKSHISLCVWQKENCVGMNLIFYLTTSCHPEAPNETNAHALSRASSVLARRWERLKGQISIGESERKR